jgi:hypothetical protein
VTNVKGRRERLKEFFDLNRRHGREMENPSQVPLLPHIYNENAAQNHEIRNPKHTECDTKGKRPGGWNLYGGTQHHVLCRNRRNT